MIGVAAREYDRVEHQRMIPKSGNRFSDKIMRQEKVTFD